MMSNYQEFLFFEIAGERNPIGMWREFELRYLAVTFRHIGGQRVSSFRELGQPNLQLANHSVLGYFELRWRNYLWTLGLKMVR